MEWATLNDNWSQRISKIGYLGTPWASLSRVGRRETKCESHQISVVSPSLTDLPVELRKLPLGFGFHQGVALHLLRGMGFPLHSPESNLALWFNSSINDLETAMLIERYIIGDKGFSITPSFLQLQFAIHDQMLEELPVAHQRNAVTAPRLVPLLKPEQ
jgi:hypothetical protein